MSGDGVVRLFIGDHMQLAPLFAGDIAVRGVRLDIVRDGTPKTHDYTGRDTSMPAAELSLARHLLRLAEGDRSWVGIPVFPLREFSHRFFYVRRGSRLRDLRDLQGSRIGVADWAATGATWGRAAIAAAGVDPSSLEWLVGGLERPSSAAAVIPPHASAVKVRAIPAERSLREMLVAGDLDCVFGGMKANPDDGIVRLVDDFVAAEARYYAETRIYPGVHLICVRRDVYESYPEILRDLFETLEESRLSWQRRLDVYHGGTPWFIADVERTRALMGSDWQPGGVELARPMIEALLDRQLADGLLRQRPGVSDIFREFNESERSAAAARL